MPHDWSVEHSFTQEKTSGATAYLPGGIGWYRKSFTLPSNSSNKVTWIEFDGVYSNSEVWINGEYLGKRPYGYIPFKYDLTQYLKPGEENQIAVKVDRSAYIDCRWYPGSGIYRNVKLVTTNKVHIPQWGTFITTPEVSENLAVVEVKTEITNEFKIEKSGVLNTSIFYNEIKVSNIQTKIILEADELNTTQQKITINNPNIWDVENPHMYKAVSEIVIDNVVMDTYETSFGIRKFSFDKDKGFFLQFEQLIILHLKSF